MTRGPRKGSLVPRSATDEAVHTCDRPEGGREGADLPQVVVCSEEGVGRTLGALGWHTSVTLKTPTRGWAGAGQRESACLDTLQSQIEVDAPLCGLMPGRGHSHRLTGSAGGWLLPVCHPVEAGWPGDWTCGPCGASQKFLEP